MKSIILDVTSRSISYDLCLIKHMSDDSELWVTEPQYNLNQFYKTKNKRVFSTSVPKKYKMIYNLIILTKGYSSLLFKALLGKISIVHFQWLPFYENGYRIELLILSILSFLKIRKVLTIHNVRSHETNELVFDERTLKAFDGLIVHNEYSFNEIKENYNLSNRLKIIPHGPLDSKNVSKRKLIQEDKYVLFFGSIRPYKGVDDLVKVWNQIENKNGFKLVLAGKNFGEKLSLNKTDIIEIDEYISEADLNRLILDSFLVVFPYKHISMSGALLKALFAHKIVLLSNIPPFRNIIKDGYNGYIFKDLIDLKNKLCNLFNRNEDFDVIINNLKEFTNTYPSWNEISIKTEELYQALLMET